MLQTDETRSKLKRAFEYYIESGELENAVDVAVYPVGYGANTGIPDLVNGALRLVAPDSHDAGRLLSQYGFNRGEEGDDYEGAQEALAQALAIAEHQKDVDRIIRILKGNVAKDCQIRLPCVRLIRDKAGLCGPRLSSSLTFRRACGFDYSRSLGLATPGTLF